MPEPLPFNPAEVADRLLAWYAESGRDLPWRRTCDPYHVWLSEIMLQQTTVAAVIPYYQRFLASFPDIESLAAAPVEAVIELWAGLGYYRRARNLHAAAVRLVEDFGGVFPATMEEVLSLPGIGRSTAGAILSIAFEKSAPILDGNVRRILCRLFALRQPARSSAAEKRLWRWAEVLTPVERPGDYAQAIMDLGAGVCLPRQPACQACPLAGLCQALRLGLERELPVTSRRKPVPLRRQVALALRRDGALLLRRRPLTGMLPGLWEFPNCEPLSGESAEQAARRLLTELGGKGEVAAVGEVRHVYSHFRLRLSLFVAEACPDRRIAEGEASVWAPAASPEYPLHGAHRKALALLKDWTPAGDSGTMASL
ncbi:A/G-specific DNA-adenine glycosylase [Geothermobacter ehrlichii]|uniref:Adenine DNA glycosylase n=1 Tax=Geothermobacter ehrlichii TaxID=213224 RepID=A0A5D3WGN3_9BACT|nr:A/G-specific adenine glycosylase [Geothermobacter ehrlichii]TYO95436.1 A/G-specific DNA-adenine glycosylase [Geothermobacter ehrlichii]